MSSSSSGRSLYNHGSEVTGFEKARLPLSQDSDLPIDARSQGTFAMSRQSTDKRGRPLFRIDPCRSGLRVSPGSGVSGRKVVAAGVLGLLILWGTLYLLFLGWRNGVEDRIQYGKTEVVPVVKDMASRVPPGIREEDWRNAVADTEAMLDEVVGTGRLDRPELEALRSDLLQRVSQANRSPELSLTILGGIWDDMGRLKRFRSETKRPTLLPDATSGYRLPHVFGSSVR